MKLIRTTGRNARESAKTLAALEQRGGAALDAVLPAVGRIVAEVRKSGDRALLRYAAKFDGLAGQSALRVTREEMAAAWKTLDPALRDALTTAARQIRNFARRQMPKSWNTSPLSGLTTGQLVRPLGSVGCYVPSGRYPLPSTLLMTAIPALVAGVKRIVVVSPKPAPETLAAAHLLGIEEFYRLGGAHAVAALAYGTASLPRVDKIVGPGNLYVTAAKRLVAFDCAIDMLAGPTEIVVTSERGNAAGIASDLVAQAEHDPEALAIFVTTREDLAKSVIAETKLRSRNNPVAREALRRNGLVIVAGSIVEVHAITNRLAPEHLTVDAATDLKWVENAGSVFVGRWSAQPMGDYISGPNHTLPTGGMARVRGGLSVNDFVKLITVQEYSAHGVATLGPKAALLAEAEGLKGHAEAIRTRLKGGPVADGVSTLFPTPRLRVQGMKEYHPPLGSRDAMRLDFNENTLECSPRVRETLAQISAGSLTRYPEREPVEAIVAAHLGLRAEQVALTNGVDEAIHVLFETFLDAGDELLLPVPTYTMYEVYASATDARIVTVQAADDLQFPYDRLVAAITEHTKVIAIANPNSPSGSVATREQLLSLAARAPQAVLLVDEAYFHFFGETVIDLVGTIPNLVVARTFSKAYGLAGLRLGLLAGPADLMRWIRRVLSPYSVNSLALACLPPAMEDTAYLDWYVGEVIAARTEFEAALDAANVHRWPSRTNFVLIEIGARHAEFVRLMRDAGVLVRDRSSDPGCDGRVRITIGARAQMRQAVMAFNNAMTTLRAESGKR